MTRSSLLIAALTGEPTSTSELYDRIGYLALARVGLVPYPAFRAELDKLSAAGLARRESAPDGSTLWTLAGATPEEGPQPR
jgi:hypothetical protein